LHPAEANTFLPWADADAEPEAPLELLEPALDEPPPLLPPPHAVARARAISETVMASLNMRGTLPGPLWVESHPVRRLMRP